MSYTMKSLEDKFFVAEALGVVPCPSVGWWSSLVKSTAVAGPAMRADRNLTCLARGLTRRTAEGLSTTRLV